MKTILLFIFVLAATSGFSQSILSSHLVPAFPNESDTIAYYADLEFPSGGCALEHHSTSIIGSSIDVSLFHCSGFLTVICYITDQISIGTLPSGTYILTTKLFYGSQDISGNCINYNQSDQDNLTFTVSTSTGIHEVSSAIPIVFYKNNQLKFSNLNDRYDLHLVDAIGKEVFTKTVSASEPELFLQLQSGIYFYSLLKNGVSVYSGKVVMP